MYRKKYKITKLVAAIVSASTNIKIISVEKVKQEFRESLNKGDLVDTMWIHPNDAADIPRLFGHFFDRNAHEAQLKMGIVGWLWGARVCLTTSAKKSMPILVLESQADVINPNIKPVSALVD